MSEEELVIPTLWQLSNQDKDRVSPFDSGCEWEKTSYLYFVANFVNNDVKKNNLKKLTMLLNIKVIYIYI